MMGIRSLPKGSSKGARERRDTATMRTRIRVKHTTDGFLGGQAEARSPLQMLCLLRGLELPAAKGNLAQRKKTSAAQFLPQWRQSPETG